MICQQLLQDRIQWKFLILAILKLWFPLPQKGVPQFPSLQRPVIYAGLYFMFTVLIVMPDTVCVYDTEAWLQIPFMDRTLTGYITVPPTIG
jgi:hypothetical protein